MSSSLMKRPLVSTIKQVLTNFSICLPETLNLDNQHGHLTNDSRKVKVGDIFCAVIGHELDGRKYIETAIQNGANLVLSECESKAEHGKINFCDIAENKIAVISFYALNIELFKVASLYYQSPEKNMTMIGVTGTNGKTSTSQLIGQLLSSGKNKCAIIGTNGAGTLDNLQELNNTTPSATDLVQLFSLFNQNQQLKNEKITHVVMEVSSHALEQKRVLASVFDVAVFTNLSRDHLDYHGTMDDYAAAKRQLFTNDSKQRAIINADDTQAQRWLEQWQNRENLWIYGRSELARQHDKFVSCEEIAHHNSGISFFLQTHLGNIAVQSPLMGDFNVDNLLAAIAVLLIEGMSLKDIVEKIKHIKATPGRMEAFTYENFPTAVVDYAHTPDALEKALIACRQHCKGNLLVVFGCGGDRDKGKRPLMAKTAQQYADAIVITTDNPRTEEPLDIIEEIVSGINDGTQTQVIVDRKQAVLETLSKAHANDVVLLAGKGHEDYIITGKTKVVYNERAVVKSFYDSCEEHSLAGQTI